MTADGPKTKMDPRRALILEGAMGVFLNYGFQRATMDDIARAADISRPALYIVFRNKTDIYRALARDFVREALDDAHTAIDSALPLAERLERALGGMLDRTEEIERSPHGAEILDMKNSLAADIVAEARARMLDLLTGAVAQEAGALGRPPEEAGMIASMILDALDGMRLRNPPTEVQRANVRDYVRLALAGLHDR